MTNPSIYTVGGTVQAGGGIYVPRHADNELLELCRQSIFTYILTSRQMGKSSLMVRTAERLADEDIQSVVIDLTQLGVKLSAEQWYLGLLSIIEEALMLDTDVVEWWQSRNHLGFTQRLIKFFQEVLLVEVTSPVVIFVDEIDTTLSLDFTDDFFAAIRYLYVARAQDTKFERLSFVLIGVATPPDLIRDPKRTPFNIGQRLDLTDFSFSEAMPLAEGLGVPGEPAQQLLRYVLEWTGGHPYLTQRLCSVISEQGKDGWSDAAVKQSDAVVKQIVSSTFFGKTSQQDNNLQFVRDMLTKRAENQDEVLTVYREIRLGRRSVIDEEQSIVKSHLKLSGVVRCEDNVLRLRNRIYEQVFDRNWINENLPISYWGSIFQKIASSYLLGIVISLLGSLTGLVIANYYREREIRQFNHAQYQTQLLADYQDAVLGSQLHSAHLPALVENPQQLAVTKDDFFDDVQRVQEIQLDIANFIESKPGQLAVTRPVLQVLIEEYDLTLQNYVDQIQPILDRIEQQKRSQQLSAEREKLLTILGSNTAMRITILNKRLSNILANARRQESLRAKDIQLSRGIERSIAVFSILVSAIIAAIATRKNP